MKHKIFLSIPIDMDANRGEKTRKRLVKAIEGCGHEVIGAGIGENPIIPIDADKRLCKVIACHDLNEQKKCTVTITVLDGKTFSVGTPIEFYTGYLLGHYSILYITNSKHRITSIFLKAFADKITRNEPALREVLISLR